MSNNKIRYHSSLQIPPPKTCGMCYQKFKTWLGLLAHLEEHGKDVEMYLNFIHQDLQSRKE